MTERQEIVLHSFSNSKCVLMEALVHGLLIVYDHGITLGLHAVIVTIT